ncbi:MAG: hypothetical protein ACTS3F_06495 [Phycisphaerales bacterium]
MRSAPAIITVAILILLAIAAALTAANAPRPAVCITCRAELRSWVVSRPHPGRHLFVDIKCPEGYEHLNDRVEYTSAALRRDYQPVRDRRFTPRVARMSRGGILVPYFGDVNDTRLEAFYVLTLEQAQCLQRDRMFSQPYELLGPNSTSGLIATLEDCGCDVPQRIKESGGWSGEFPGAEFTPGPDLPEPLWARYGVPDGPDPLAEPGSSDQQPATPLTREQRVHRIIGRD